MISYNENLGFLPVSNFINCSEDFKNEDVYYKLIEDKCRDIILYGNLKDKEEQLKWLTSRLISETFFVSIVTPINRVPEVANNRIIIPINFAIYKQNIAFLSSMEPRDIIVIVEEDAKKFIFIVNNINTKAKLFYDVDLISEYTVLKSKYYHLSKYKNFIDLW